MITVDDPRYIAAMDSEVDELCGDDPHARALWLSDGEEMLRQVTENVKHAWLRSSLFYDGAPTAPEILRAWACAPVYETPQQRRERRRAI